MEAFSVAMTNRSIRTVKAELEFLADNGTITHAQLSNMLSQLPAETQGIRSAPTPVQSVPTPAVAPAAAMSNLSLNNGYANTNSFSRTNSHAETPSYNTNNEKQQDFYQPPSGPPPPAYPATPQPPPAALTYATAMYAYPGTDNGDLGMQPNDRIAVTEYMNADWWKGRNERTGQEGIFPRNYVKVEDIKQPSNYGNMPLDVAQGSSSQEVGPDGKPNKGAEMGKKFGKKLGNAAIFGAGATMGSNLVNSIF